MKQLLIPAIVCILFILLESCMKKIVPPDPKTVAVDKETSSLKGEPDSKDTIYITSNDQWVVNIPSGVDWLSVQPAAGDGDGMIIIATTKQNNSPTRKTT